MEQTKQKVLLVTVSDDRFGRKDGKYSVTQDKVHHLFKINQHFGITDHFMLKWEELAKSDFYKMNVELLINFDAARNGRVYKPYAISEGLKTLKDGDFLIYTDCSPELWNMDKDFKIDPRYNVEVLKSLCVKNNGILSAFVKWDNKNIPEEGLGIHTHANFTTDRCMKKMNLEKHRNDFMHASGMMVFQKSKHTVDFVEEWLQFNRIDECASLGHASKPNDYSFWNEEEANKMGHRHDQSISGLLINKYGHLHQLIDIHYDFDNMSPYSFLAFSRTDINYKFIDSRQYIKEWNPQVGDIAYNRAGSKLTVFEIRPENGIDWLIVGQHKESCYRTTKDKLIIK